MGENENAAEQRGAVPKTFRPNIPVPAKLDVHARNLEAAWRKFKRQWTNYEVATHLDTESPKYRKAVFLSVIGEDAFDVFDGFSFEEEESEDDITDVIAKFEQYCVGESNEIYESFLFNQRSQQEGETIDAYVTALRKMAKTCNFGTNEERMLRDRIVLGVRDDLVRQKLLEDRHLTLTSCIEVCRAHESSHLQAKAIVSGTGATVDRVMPMNKAGSSLRKCKKCGRPHKPKETCPAKNAECRACHRKGHYAAMCYARAPRTQSRDISKVCEGEGEGHFLGAVSRGGTEAWYKKIKLDRGKVNFKLDTGADVTVVPEQCVPKSARPLQKSAKELLGPGRKKLSVLGKFNTTLAYKGITSVQEIYVVEDLQEPLLGRPAIEALQLVTLVDSVKSVTGSYRDRYPELFSGLGKMKETYKIRLKEDAVPRAVTAPRRVPLPMQKKLEAELKRLQDMDVIRPVTTPTDWCSGIVVVPKEKKDTIRLCVDLTKLNESVRRENYPLPSTDQLLAQLADATVFTKLDCNSGFHQVPLDEASQELTTFITPQGRFCYKRLPFGISSGPEVFHRIMAQLLSNIPGVICDIDDILVSGRNQEEHDLRLEEVLQRLLKAGVTLNDKCAFSQKSIRFLGHIISEEGIKVDPAKVEAIQQLPRPQNVPELRRLLGMLNFVQKFAPDLADQTRPLRDLLKKDIQWTWGDAQESAFIQLKKKLSSPPVLAHYNPDRPTKVSADASSYGLGAVLLQQQDGEWRPIFYASRSMTSTEQRYAQVEKEALASTWACEKFADFLLGLPSFTIETDHRPLLALLKTKTLDELSPRIQRFRMRLMRYSYQVIYTAGKNLTTADALSRAPVGAPQASDLQLETDARIFVQSVIDGLPATQGRLVEIKTKQQEDQVCRQVMQYCLDGWPADKNKVDPDVRPYYQVRDDLSVQEGLIMFGTRLVIPAVLRKDILCKIHDGHQGIVKCRALARSSVWWPGLSQAIQTMVDSCGTCIKERKARPEPLRPSGVPDYPWQRVGMDLFDWHGLQYLLVVDYFSKNIELAHLTSTSSERVILHCKSIFARHGIPEEVQSDNGPQFASHQFGKFATEYGFTHRTSSPHFPQANGEAERAVQTVKNFLARADDPYLALLNYRATPLQCGFSPAELSMGRRLRTRVPIVPTSLTPEWPKLSAMKEANASQKEVQKEYFDKRHRATELPALSPGDPVWVKEPREQPGEVVRPVGPRSYIVNTPSGRRRRNRRHLNRRRSITSTPGAVNPGVPSTLPSPDKNSEMEVHPEAVQQPAATAQSALPPVREEKTTVKTRYGRTIKPPKRLDL